MISGNARKKTARRRSIGYVTVGGVLLAVVALLPGRGILPGVEAQGPVSTRRVNAPYFVGDVRLAETAVFWFGQVDRENNYADVRIGYSNQYLTIRVAAFDRRLWYDPTPTGPELTAWDAVSLYLDVGQDGGSVPKSGDYCFVAQLSGWGDPSDYRAAYQGNGAGWAAASIPFTGESGWRGDALNDNSTDDRGWVMGLTIPFASLGLSGPPPDGSVWGLALALHDRDDSAGTFRADKVWPEAMDGGQPATWGELAFGLPTWTSPPAVPGGEVVVRHGLNGASVADAHVGGGAVCGDPYGPDYFAGWGEANYAGSSDINIQNQADIADWPCFSKYYVTFPLDGIPAGKTVISATLTMYQFGGSGGPEQAQPSLIQVLTVGRDWEEATITWNNAPPAVENISSAWVFPLAEFPGWPGVANTWDVSRAVAEAHAAGTPLRLALYEADTEYHSGKHFVSSDTGEWNAEGRPTLRVSWGDPVGTVEKTVSSAVAMPGDAIAYTVTLVGSGQSLTLTDDLPAGVGAPTAYSPGLVYTPHRLSWAGTPGVGAQVVLTYVVDITAPSRIALWNHATVTQGGGLALTASALVLVDPAQVYLPLILGSR